MGFMAIGNIVEDLVEIVVVEKKMNFFGSLSQTHIIILIDIVENELKIKRLYYSFCNEFPHLLELCYVTEHVVAHHFVHVCKYIHHMRH